MKRAPVPGVRPPLGRRARLASAFISVTALVSPQTVSAEEPTPSHEAVPDAGPQLDIHHEPPSEAPVDTPLPLYVELLPEGHPARTAVISYRPFGATKYKKLAMTRTERGFSVEIPCMEIVTTGPFLYYFTFFEDEDRIVGALGSRQEPFRVPVLNELAGDPPRLPGEKPPRRCGGNPPPCMLDGPPWCEGSSEPISPPPVPPIQASGCGACSLAETDAEGVPLGLTAVVTIAAVSRPRRRTATKDRASPR